MIELINVWDCKNKLTVISNEDFASSFFNLFHLQALMKLSIIICYLNKYLLRVILFDQLIT